jgi:hypothetical protein
VTVHEGPGHADVTLSLCGEADGGGHWHQAWGVCECGLAGLRRKLGEPLHESLSDAEAVRRAVEFVKDDPGRVHLLGGDWP